MSDAATPPPNDLEAQLEALMQQAREGNAAPDDTDADETQEASAESPSAVAVETPPKKTDKPAPPQDLAAQLDTLMAKVENDKTSAEEDADEKTPAEADPFDTSMIADGPDDVEDAFDDLQDAFDAAQDLVAELDENPPSEAPPVPEPVAATAEAPEAEAESPDQDDDLASQVQSLLDEASAQEAESFVAAEDVLSEAPATDEADAEDDGLDGDFEAPAVEAAAEKTADKPLIEQIDSLLADHANEAITGELESVDEMLGVSDTAGEYMADPTEDLAGEEDDDDEDDGLGGDFQSMDDLLAKPTEEEPAEEPVEEPAEQTAEKPAAAAPAPPPPPSHREEPAKELDEIDGLFAAPVAMSAAPAKPARPETAPADDKQDVGDEGDESDEGGFESLDALLTAPPPSEDDRDGAPPPAKAKSKTKAEAKTKSSEGWELTLNLSVLKAAVMFVAGSVLWTCALVNKPVDKLPDEIKQTVGWVALAVAGPGLLLVVYGLLFN